MIARFARLEFEFGSVERARTVMEGIVTNYPKRTDLWSVYLDMEVKFGDPQKARWEMFSNLNLTDCCFI